MQSVILACLVVVAAAQIFPFNWWNGHESDRHAGYTFEYHNRHHLLLVRDRRHCYIVEDTTMEVAETYHNKETRESVEDDIIKHIKDNDGLHRERPWESVTHHHDPLAAAECVGKAIYELTYKLPANLMVTTTASA
ncbi:hypothetical protein LOTGIDRAFT_237322 [Lottia gigantea]|uniref:Uncharacterized protein n=1 Tax=Lottia gigantea TaxID=225164 RepID=V4B306_LOTGI|nr:hypothetical protein LOTGIDRAFT_237322 [Lottia gigantea]ESP04583.1 hypothetical protein LOTGIDRAFT_237322 [Lottia gigantea]